ncbi:hypothetical protein [Actinophytocola sp.]|uniref:hypothetical protein n=1 Tax=Actinophytocola sp. TaxID=1872138 RepID=UPI00389A166E
MTTNHLPTPHNPPATMPVNQMESYIADGRAERWTQPLGDMIPVAALLDGAWEQHNDETTGEGTPTWVLRSGTWYVVWDTPKAPTAERVYELAPPELAAVLTEFQARLRTANEQVAEADAQSAAPLGGFGEVVPPTPRRPEP